MNKKITKLIAALALLVFMTPTMAGWGQTRTETTTTYTFSSKSWAASPADWTSGKDGNQYTNDQGVQVTTGVTGANATSPISFTDVSKVEVRYCTNASSGVGTIKIQVGNGTEKSFSVTKPSSGGTTLKTATFTYSTYETGAVKITVNCTTNSVYIYSVAITTTTSSSTVTAPEISPGSCNFTGTKQVTITPASGTTMYFTYGANPADPDNSGTGYTTEQTLNISSTTTVKAIAYVGDNASSIATETYTYFTPLTTMQDIYDANTTGTDQYVAITFNDWIITGASSSYAFLSDGDKGLYILGGEHGFVQGDILSGTVVCKLSRNTGMAKLTQLTNETAGIQVGHGANPTPTVTTINTVEGINTGKLITLNGLTCHVDGTTYSFTDGENRTVYPYSWGGLSNYRENLSEGKTYDVTGVFSYGNNTNEKRIHPRTVTEIMPTPTTLPFSWNGGVKADLLAVTGVTSSGLGSDYSADDHDPYLVKLDGTGDYIMVRTDSQPGVVTIGVKKIGGASNNSIITVQASTDGVNFDAGQNLAINGAQNAIVTLTSTREFSADVRYIRLYFTKGANIGVGPISITKAKYAITLNTPTTGGSFTADKASADAGEIVTLTPEAATHYVFTSWTVCKTGDESTTVDVDNNQFVMPAYPVTVSATFTALQERTIIIPTEIEDKVVVDVTGNKAYAGDEVKIMIYAPINEFLTSLTVTGYTTSNLITLSPEVSSEIDEYTFTMPDENVTIAATFAGEFTVQFSVNGTNTGSQTVTAGNSVALSSPEPPTGFEFAGWTTNPTNFDNIITGSSYTPTANVTLYAVYSRTITGTTVTAYNKVSSISAGDYLIVCESYNVAFDGSRDNTTNNKIDASNNTINVTIDEYSIASSESTDAAIFTIAAITGGYSIQSASGFYIGSDSHNNELDVDNENALLNTIEIDDDGNAVIIGYYSSSTSYTALRYNATSGQERFRYYKEASQQAIQLYKKETTTPSTTEYYTRIQSIDGSTTEITTVTPADLITVPSGAVLTITGPCTGGPENLIIEDGGQLIVNTSSAKTGSGVYATVQKEITGFGGDNEVQTGWYTIASPLTSNFTPAGDMLENTYDLYYLDESANKWYNYKQNVGETNVHSGFSIEPNKGYLYANSANTTINFAGEVRVSSSEVPVTLSYTSSSPIDGTNLVGNPFTCNITGNVKIGDDDLSAYYIANGTISGGKNLIPCELSERAIKPCEGFIVQTDAVKNLVFNPTPDPGKRGESVAKPSYLRIEAGNADFMDRAYVQIGQGNTLRKMTINNNVSHVYVMNDGKDYAAATIEEVRGEMPVNFKAAQDGQYTITVNPENVEMGYLHLIDNIAGVDVDLLALRQAQGPASYTFNAKGDDYESRFRLVFSTTMVNAEMGEDFAFISDGQLVIANVGEATLQVIDVTGRVVATENINGTCSKAISAKAGVYVLRLINGTDVKTQKIVIR